MSRLRLRLAVAAAALLALAGAGNAMAAGTIVISQVYGGGGNTGAPFTHDFVELFNRSAVTVSLDNWSLQYASATGTGNFGSSSSQLTALTGTIAPGQYVLVREAPGTGTGVALPTQDVTDDTPIAMSGSAGKIALASTPLTLGCNGNAAQPCSPAALASIVDLVGYGSATFFEGSAAAPTLTNTTAAFRRSNGCVDTDNNGADFQALAPAPRNRLSPLNPCVAVDSAPTVASSTPAPGATNVSPSGDVTVTFSESVDTTGDWFTITCATSGAHAAVVSGGPTTFTLDPVANFRSNEACTVTVLAANVTDQDSADPPDNMAANYTSTFQTADVFACGDPATAIHDVQGAGLSTPLAGSTVTIEGVVGGDYQLKPREFGGFYLQEEAADADADPATSEGIFVFDNGFGVDVHQGDIVRVRGTASESFSLTQVGAVNAVQVCSTGATVPVSSVSLPVASLTDLERFEGMRVHFDQTLTATEVFNLGRFGEISLSGAGRLYTPTAVTTPGPAAIAKLAENKRSRIILDDGVNVQNIDPTVHPEGGLSASNTLRVGYTTAGLNGVLDYRFSNYRIQPVAPVSFAATNPRTAAPAAVGGNLKVASFNVLNYFNGNGTGGGFPTSRGANTAFEFARQRDKIISALKAIDGDIVGLMEIENDATPGSAIEDLVAGLNGATAPGTYSFVDTGVIGTDAIRVALIYKPSAVAPVGVHKIITTATDPLFIDTKNRPSLAQTFRQLSTGSKLTVVVNHLKSKGSDCNDIGDPDSGDGSGNCNITRTNAAKAIADWLATDPTGSGDPDFLLIGDMNSYTFESPITAFEGKGFTNLIRRFGGLEPYSYVFNGESGYLDHGLATSSLADQATGAVDWHINPDEPTVLDYNTEFKTANQVNTFYAPTPYRASDHDPVVLGFQLNSPPVAEAGGPYTVAEGGSVTLTASATDWDGGALTYAWDLDGDGAFDDATGPTASFSAAALDGPVTKTVRVEVTDAGGLSSTDDATVSVTNVAPTATFEAPESALAGSAFTLSLTNPDDAAPADEPGLTYAFDCGDGAGYGAFSTVSTATCPTLAVGTRNVGGKIGDDDGGVTEYRDTVAVTVTYASLCSLTESYVTNAGIAHALCVKLEAAARAEARGKEKELQNYVNQVQAQSGKALTAEHAATLIALAGNL